MLESILRRLERFALTARRGFASWLRSNVLAETLRHNWYLGLTSFGGPPVHFKIFNGHFVLRIKWIDEQMYQELFSLAQALSGPGSTKMLYCINLIHGGTISAITSLLIWSIPMAATMYGLSLGVSSIDSKLPAPAYALLSGLNAATVGVIALAAVELSGKAITDNLTRMIVFLVASAGLLYNALWYFPVLMVIAGIITIVHDYRLLHKPVAYLKDRFRLRRTRRVFDAQSQETGEAADFHDMVSQQVQDDSAGQVNQVVSQEPLSQTSNHEEPRVLPQELRLNISWQVGVSVIVIFLLAFLVIMVLRATLVMPTLLFRLFANMCLAGTIIFGGGPVVIPLLREYVVAEGWVSERDFLIGLALIQALPGPNFNFAVFLGGLTASNGGYSSVAGAVVAWLGIFTPGIVLVHGTMGVWTALRNRRWVKSILRGINAAAVGLIYTAVYRIWQSGYLSADSPSGQNLGSDPWWIVVAAASYLGGYWFHVPAIFSIVSGAVLGLIRYAVVRSN